MRTHACILVVLVLAGCTTRTASISPAAAVAADQAAAPQMPPDKPDPPKADAPKPEAAGDGFHFPDDRGGRLLGQLLPPSGRGSPADDHVAPRQFKESPVIAAPSAPPPATAANVVRLPEAKASRPPRPGPLPEGVPLFGYRGLPEPPGAGVLPAGELVRVPLVDVNEPPPLPRLGEPAPDRAPLDDPTLDASLAAALAASPPARTAPAPFLRLTLPEPFENRQVVRLRSTPAEEPTPVAAAPRGPKP
jgi:hypothetical protein